MNTEVESRLEFAIEAARASSMITVEYFGQNSLECSEKADGTPVTVADRACEYDLRKRIGEAFSEDSILGEEFPRKTGSNEYEWVIDPIDGTISFVHGVPLYGTMLACMRNGQPIVGVITMPMLRETVYAADGCGCWHMVGNLPPVRCSVSQTSELKEAMLNMTSMNYFETHAQRALYEQLDVHSKYTRGWSDCYGFVLLATGRVDAVIEPVLSLWDFAAAIPIIQEAGGVWSDFSNQQSLETGELIATTRQLLPQILELIDPSIHSSKT